MNNSPLYNRISRSLADKKQNNLFRKTAVPFYGQLVDVSTNSYLSLHANAEVCDAARTFMGNQLHGNLASRIISSNSPLFNQLEAEIASWENTEAALIFNSGYAANIGIITSLCNRDTEIFSDKLNHASIIDGIKLSGGHLIRYQHCNMADLEEKLKISSKKDKLIITDTVFSMDGDTAPLAEICNLAERFSCMVMVDEAHATGIFGKTGSGLVEHLGLDKRIDIRMGTFSKALAGFGGYFAGQAVLRDYFVNTSRSLIYSTGLPQSVLAYNFAAIRHVRTHPGLGTSLIEKSIRFIDALRGMGFSTLNASTQIVPCIFGKEDHALNASKFCYEHGIKVPAIRPPTVPAHTSRLRFSLNSDVTDSHIDHILKTLGALSHGK